MKSCLRPVLLLLSMCSVLAQAQPSLNINDLPGNAADNIASYLSLGRESCSLGSRRLATLAEGLDEKIDRALRALGYYQADWQHEIKRSADCWSLSLDVEPGPPVTVGEVNLDLRGPMAEDPNISALLAEARAFEGRQLNHADYERLKRRLQSFALRYGYMEGQFTTQQLLVDVDANSARINLVFDGGPRYVFGDVSYAAEAFDEEFLRRYQAFETGQAYDSRLLGDYQQALLNTVYFDNVLVADGEPDAETKRIPVQVSVTPGAKYVSSIGLGFATDTGPRASFAFDHNRLNRVGHQYSTSLELSPVESTFNFDYRIPLANPRSEQASIRSGWTQEKTDTAESDIWFVGGGYTTAAPFGGFKTLDLVYQVESYEVGTTEDRAHMLIPGISWNKTRADDMLYPRDGFSLLSGFRGSLDSPVSDVSFVQFNGSAKYIKQLGPGRFLSRLTAGATWVGETSELPASLRFFAGGDSSVRGYAYESLGPRDADGLVVGGRHMLTGSVEYEFELSRQYGLAFFYDVGNAFDDEDFNLVSSLGFGGRWRSPIGPVRIDFAFPQDSDDSFRVHLSMGTDL